ncbi:tagatose 1,6-diphosphate aldolase [Fimbriiglobus ruber]|uniref:Tagatose 1,6-bisphosphate aldolase n=1 Tax=Fimbriiglobus ruber TaxID=1908690 RepID=A0A225DCU2_9BACT|nr:tagatose 1,6-diphosphate aldolase [Fimbriiglobus ruber]OWK37454.1 Tagatose 1,6-bisphosphate aldolase [Fimbriiglobus ruber]
MSLSVTRLLGLGLTPGKLRGLQRISNPNGTLTMVATDQNSSMMSMMKKATGKEPTYADVVDAKVMLSRALSPHCSGLLVDGYYGYWSTVAAQAVPSSTGLLIRVEKSGAPKNKAGAPQGEVETGWGVAKIKRCGADAVKLLAQFEPAEFDSAEHNFEFTRKMYEDCIAHDILFLLEPIHFPYNGEDEKSPSKIARKASTVIESARILSRYCDIFKAEFPGTPGVESDAQLVDNLKKLNDACAKPWVLLSAGVDYPQYKKQVEMAMKAGASGILGGRAFWKEFFTYTTPAERQKFAETECTKRVQELDAIVKSGTPWFAKYGYTSNELHELRAAEGWHARYGGGTVATTGPVKVDPNAVY